MNLYKFNVDCGRMGELSGLFAATHEEMSEMIGKRAYFGDVLGKHSEIHGEIEESEITLLSDDQEFVAQAIAAKVVPFGHDPKAAIEESEECCGE